MGEVKTIMIGTRATGTATSRHIVMAIRNEVLKSNNPKLLKQTGGSLQLTENWIREVLKFMNWVKIKDTTGKIEPFQQLLLEEKLTFRKKISGAIFYHDSPKELIVNLNQTPLSYVSPGKYIFDVKVLKPFLLKVLTTNVR